MSGEVWRIVTGNGVHFSKSHLVYDLLAFALAGTLIELRGHRGFAWLCLICPPLIGFAVLLTQPNLQIFGGLSGLATGTIVFLSLHGLRERGPWRWICLLTLAATGVKIGLEFATGQLAFAQSAAILMKAVPESHVAGALGAIVTGFLTRERRSPAALTFNLARQNFAACRGPF